MTEDNKVDVIVIGGGPAGLTAARELQMLGFRPKLVEQRPLVGGIARTEQYKKYRFDIGGHRFYTKVPEIEALWHNVLTDNFEERPRLSRIYYRQKYFPYPIKLLPTLSQLGVIESVRILLSYLGAQIAPSKEEATFEQWVCNRFGKRLFNTFFKSYTEKVWGIPTDEIRAEWAAQRIKGLSMMSTLRSSLFGNQGVTSLIDTFHYPIYGPGMMWEAFQASIEAAGGIVQVNTPITRLCLHHQRIVSVETGAGERFNVDQVISSMSLKSLIRALHPAPPEQVQLAVNGLNYRAFLIVGLIVEQADLFPDNWLYVHEPEVKVGRIQNFKNWSASMVPDPAFTSLGMEYFCNEGDALWQMADDGLIALATRELEQLGLVSAELVVDGVVIRQAKAYPVYDADYRVHLGVIRDYLSTIENLQTIGRNGMHRYNNQDHSMLTGLLAARNLAGEQHDLWQVNTERSYYEEQRVPT